MCGVGGSAGFDGYWNIKGLVPGDGAFFLNFLCFSRFSRYQVEGFVVPQWYR